MSYRKLIFSRALKETRAFWNVHQMWKYAATPVSAIILRLLVKRWSPIMGWEGFLKETVAFCIAGFIVSWVGTYLLNLVLAPGILHREQQLRIGELENRLTFQGSGRNPELSPQAIQLLKAGAEAGSHSHKIKVLSLEQITVVTVGHKDFSPDDPMELAKYVEAVAELRDQGYINAGGEITVKGFQKAKSSG